MLLFAPDRSIRTPNPRHPDERQHIALSHASAQPARIEPQPVRPLLPVRTAYVREDYGPAARSAFPAAASDGHEIDDAIDPSQCRPVFGQL